MALIVTVEEAEEMLSGKVIRRPVRPGDERELVVFRDSKKAIRLTIRPKRSTILAQAATGERVSS